MACLLGQNETTKLNVKPKKIFVSNEILLNNVLDEDFQKMLRPLNLIHSVVFLKKYDIRDNFVTSNSLKTKIISFCVIMIALTYYVYFNASHIILQSHQSADIAVTVKLLQCIDIVFYPMSVLVLFKQKVCCSNDNIKLILKLQEIEKVTKFCKDIKMYTIVNWILGICLILNTILCTIVANLGGDIDLCGYLFIYYLNMNSMYTVRVLNLLENHMRICTRLLKANFDESCGNIDIQFKKLHTCFMNILDACKIFKKTVRIAVSIKLCFYQSTI